MKKYFLPYQIIVLFLFVSFVFTNCKKDSYLTDGGVHNAITPLSNYDYLAGNKYNQFDTVIMLIDHFGLKDSVNKAGTFFAPTNYAVRRILTDNKIATLDSLYALATSKLLTQFMFTDTSISLNNASTNIQMHTNWADTTAGIRKQALSYYSVTSTFVYYALQYIKINGYLDGTSGIPATDPPDFISNCQTTGIKTSNGNTTLHVLDNAARITLK